MWVVPRLKKLEGNRMRVLTQTPMMIVIMWKELQYTRAQTIR